MKKLTPTTQKTLKTLHLVFAGAWLTCVFTLLCLPLANTKFNSGDDLYLYNKVYHFIDMMILSPAATLTLITGFIYSLMTPWGFFKHGWLIYKWIITILIVLIGTFYLGPMVSNQLMIAYEKKLLALQDNYYIRSQSIGLNAAIINFLILLIAVIVSVFKPKMKRIKI